MSEPPIRIRSDNVNTGDIPISTVKKAVKQIDTNKAKREGNRQMVKWGNTDRSRGQYSLFDHEPSLAFKEWSAREQW